MHSVHWYTPLLALAPARHAALTPAIPNTAQSPSGPTAPKTQVHNPDLRVGCLNCVASKAQERDASKRVGREQPVAPSVRVPPWSHQAQALHKCQPPAAPPTSPSAKGAALEMSMSRMASNVLCDCSYPQTASCTTDPTAHSVRMGRYSAGQAHAHANISIFMFNGRCRTHSTGHMLCAHALSFMHCGSSSLKSYLH